MLPEPERVFYHSLTHPCRATCFLPTCSPFHHLLDGQPCMSNTGVHNFENKINPFEWKWITSIVSCQARMMSAINGSLTHSKQGKKGFQQMFFKSFFNLFPALSLITTSHFKHPPISKQIKDQSFPQNNKKEMFENSPRLTRKTDWLINTAFSKLLYTYVSLENKGHSMALPFLLSCKKCVREQTLVHKFGKTV